MAKLPPYLSPEDKDYLLLNETTTVVSDALQPVPLTEVQPQQQQQLVPTFCWQVG